MTRLSGHLREMNVSLQTLSTKVNAYATACNQDNLLLYFEVSGVVEVVAVVVVAVVVVGLVVVLRVVDSVVFTV